MKTSTDCFLFEPFKMCLKPKLMLTPTLPDYVTQEGVLCKSKNQGAKIIFIPSNFILLTAFFRKEKVSRTLNSTLIRWRDRASHSSNCADILHSLCHLLLTAPFNEGKHQ